MKTATLVKDRLEGFAGHAQLYRVDPPISLEREWDEESKGQVTEYVVVSAAVVEFIGRPETYIFPADAEGKVTSWGELEGSFNGGLDHQEALRGAGYEVVR